MAFSLDTLAVKDSFSLHLKHPVSEEALFADDAKTLPVEISLFGTSSKQFRTASLANQNAYIKRGKKPLTAEGMQQSRIDLLVACSDKGSNIEYHGRELNDAEVFRALYSDPSFEWLKDQVDAALGDVANFLEV